MGVFNYDNPIMRGITKMAKCIFLGILWITFCIPMFTVGAATSAMYYTVHKAIKQDRGYVAASFFQAFKENFKISTILWIIIIIAETIFFTDYWILSQLENVGKTVGNFYPVFVVLMGIVVLYSIWIFISVARFENTVGHFLKNSFILMIRHLGTTIMIAINLLVCIIIIYLIPVTVLLMPVIITWIISEPVEKVFSLYVTEDKYGK